MLIADDGIVSGPDDPDRQNAQMTNMFASGGGMSADTMASVASSAKGLVSAAKSGGFKISEDGVKPMRNAIADMMERLRIRIRESHKLAMDPKIGSGPYQQRVAPHYASGGETAQQALLNLRDVLRDCDEALARAAGVYKETDDAGKDSFSRNSGNSAGEYSGGGSFKAD